LIKSIQNNQGLSKHRGNINASKAGISSKSTSKPIAKPELAKKQSIPPVSVPVKKD
jgi:hypothetical protein